jgi:NifU-like protein
MEQLATPAPPAKPSTANDLYAQVKEALEELRPYLRADGGDCELIAVEGNLVTVRMTGACIACQFSGATLNGLQERLIQRLGMPLRIASVPGPR